MTKPGRTGFKTMNEVIEYIVKNFDDAGLADVAERLTSDEPEEDLLSVVEKFGSVELGEEFYKSLDKMQATADGQQMLRSLREWLASRIGRRLLCTLALYWHDSGYRVSFEDGLAIVRCPVGAFCVDPEGKGVPMEYVDNRH
jgi:hypothetical protein